MFSTWDIVRPRYWYPMSMLEQSMMELDHMADHMFSPTHATSSPFGREVKTSLPSLLRDRGAGFPFQEDDDDFFRGLPLSPKRPRQPERQQKKSKKAKHSGDRSDNRTQEQQTAEQGNTQPVPAPAIDDGEANGGTSNTSNTRGFSSYSFSSSSVLDDQGRRVTSTRRRYEDSTGRLKALHEREVDGKKLRKTWSRQHKDDEGVHECVCSSGSAEEFEKMWASTPFGEAQTKSLEGGDASGGEPKKLKTSSSRGKNGADVGMKTDKP